MKRILLIALTLIFTANCFADCRDVARNSKDNFMNEAKGAGQYLAAGVGGVGGATAVLLVGGGTVVIGGLLVGGVAGAGVHVAIKNGKRNRVIELIDQAKSYSNSNGKALAGKLLIKLHKKVKKHSQGYSLLQIADFITESNENGSLCPGNKFVSLKKIMKSAPLSIVEEI